MNEESITKIFRDLESDIPPICHRQLHIQRDYYLYLLSRIKEYDWNMLFASGVHIADVDGDPDVFMSRLSSPVKILVFAPSDNDRGYEVLKNIMHPSLLQQKLLDMEIYIGPILSTLKDENGKDISNPYRIGVDTKNRLAKVVYI